MKNSLLVVCMSLISVQHSCSVKDVIRPAKLTFDHLTISDKADNGIFQVRFSSDVYFSKKIIEEYDNHLIMNCYLFNYDTKITIDLIRQNNQYLLSGEIMEISSDTVGNSLEYGYKSNMKLYNFKDNGTTSSTTNNTKSIAKLIQLHTNDCIPCVLYGTVYMDVVKPYVSNTMCLPKKTVLKKLRE